MKIAVHLHLYYLDQWPLLKKYLKNLGETPYDLFVTMSRDVPAIQKDIKSFHSNTSFEIANNLGYDIGPFVEILNKLNLDRYDYVLKIHTKDRSSLLRGSINDREINGKWWSTLLLESLLGTPTIWKDNLMRLEKDLSLGMISSKYLICSNVKYYGYLLPQIAATFKTIGMDIPPKLAFAAGTMFLVRSKLLQPLQGIYSINDFKEGKTFGDASLAHVLERVFGALVIAKNYTIKGFDQNYKYEMISFFRPILNFFYSHKIDQNALVHKVKILKIPIYCKKYK